MDYLNYTSKHEIFPGAVLKVDYDEKTSIYARLIQPAGDSKTFLSPNGMRSEDVLFVKQRWLIEWINHTSLPAQDSWCQLFLRWVGFYPKPYNNISKKEEWDQRMLAGGRTHRNVIYKTGKTWEEHIEENGAEAEIKNERNDDPILGDGNSIF